MSVLFLCASGGRLAEASLKDNRGNFWPIEKNLSQSSGIRTVTIGTQVWMAENLNVDTFRNGDPIPNIENGNHWYNAGNNGQPAWMYYNNHPCNDKYGKLYNFFAVEDARGLAPEGWRIPTVQDWTILSNYLKEQQGAKMKSKNGWFNKGNGNNECGFNAFPGGIAYYAGQSYDYGRYAFWWSSEAFLVEHAFAYYISHDSDKMFNARAGKRAGLAVRCIKNE